MAAEMRIMRPGCPLMAPLSVVGPWMIRDPIDGTTFCGRASSHFSEVGGWFYRASSKVLRGSSGFCRVLQSSGGFNEALGSSRFGGYRYERMEDGRGCRGSGG